MYGNYILVKLIKTKTRKFLTNITSNEFNKKQKQKTKQQQQKKRNLGTPNSEGRMRSPLRQKRIVGKG